MMIKRTWRFIEILLYTEEIRKVTYPGQLVVTEKKEFLRE